MGSSATALPALAPLPARRPDKDLLTAWVLLLLDDGDATHGYRLRGQLEAQGLDIDAGAMYRRLRQLESDGLMRSRWQSSQIGPQRRAYRLTGKGRRMRDDVAQMIATTHATQDAFLRAYEGLVREEAGAA
ncbi:MAG TPA: helix-turn-helix transcriptional regulator [Solirubrobacteraceae bacterium]|nr:helix-turn-helix transcriptional regulator [Solirubrobacteraceae bacterium]